MLRGSGTAARLPKQLGLGTPSSVLRSGAREQLLAPQTLLGWGCRPSALQSRHLVALLIFVPPVPGEELLLGWDSFIRSLPLFHELCVVILTLLSSTN